MNNYKFTEMVYELNPIYDIRLSFYHKALIIETPSYKKLMSYETEVCTIYNKNKVIILNKQIPLDLLFSHTTLRHIKEFIRQETGKIMDKSDLKKML